MKNDPLAISEFTPEECEGLIKLIMKVWRHLALALWRDKHDAEIPTLDLNTGSATPPVMKPVAATVRRYRSFADAVAAAHPGWTTMPVVAAGVVNDIWGGGENECFRANSSLTEALAWMEARRDGMLAGYVFLGGNVFLWFCDGEFVVTTGDDIVPMVQASLAKNPLNIMSPDEMALGLAMHDSFVLIKSMDNEDDRINYITMLAEFGNTEAQVQLGLDYRAGKGVEQDPQLALYWLRQAVEQEDPRFVALFGAWSMTGDGIPQNYEEAYRWLWLAARQYNPFAWCFLEKLCPDRLNRGSDPIFNLIGMMHKSDVGFPKHFDEIIKWLKIVALRCPDACFRAFAQMNLGVAYEHGIGVGKNLAKAYAWQKLAQSDYQRCSNIEVAMTLYGKLSPAELQEGERRFQEWLAKVEETERKTINEREAAASPDRAKN